MRKSGASKGVAGRADWREETLCKMRDLIKEAVPDVVEERKWRGTPVWSHQGILCTGESYEKVVKLTFARGASLKDPRRLFNASLDGNVRRAIDLHEGEQIDEAAFKALVRQAAALNQAVKTGAKLVAPRRTAKVAAMPRAVVSGKKLVKFVNGQVMRAGSFEVRAARR